MGSVMRAGVGTAARAGIAALAVSLILGAPSQADAEADVARAQELTTKALSMPLGAQRTAVVNEAAELVGKALADKPKDAARFVDVVANMGQLYQDEHNPSSSLEWWKKVVELNSNDWRAWAKIVQCSEALHDVAGRNQAKQHVLDLAKEGKVEQQMFCVDQLTVAGSPVMVFQYLKHPEKEVDRVLYSFIIFHEDGKTPKLRFTYGELLSDTELAREMKKIGADEHVYSLDRYDLPHRQTLLRMFHSSQPSEYDDIKKLVVEDIPKLHGHDHLPSLVH
jgi:hypothetical protein